MEEQIFTSLFESRLKKAREEKRLKAIEKVKKEILELDKQSTKEDEKEITKDKENTKQEKSSKKKKRQQTESAEDYDNKPDNVNKISKVKDSDINENVKQKKKKAKSVTSEEPKKKTKSVRFEEPEKKTFNDDDEVIEFGDTEDVDENLLSEIRQIIATGGNNLKFDDDDDDEKEESKEEALDSSRTIYVRNIPYETTEKDLKKLFRRCGKIMSIKLPYFHDSGKHRGYCFIEFEDETALPKAFQMNRTEINGRQLLIEQSSKK